MDESWRAWPEGADPRELRRAVALARERFLSSGRASPELRSLVRESWQRSLTSGVDPEGVCPRLVLPRDELCERRDSHVLRAALPVVRRLLVDSAADSGQIAAVGDAEGRLLWVEGDHATRARAEGMRFVEGASWSERDAGTNAPGVALALDHEVQVFSSEHFGQGAQSWSCSAAPVHDPDTGRVVGVVDLTGGDRAAQPYALDLVRATAFAVESELRLQRVSGALSRAGAPGAGERTRLRVLGRGQAQLFHRGRARRLSLRHSEILFLLAAHPEGLYGGEIASLLHEHGTPSVTVRVEVSRIRKALGEVVDSSPYRWSVPVGTDVDQVRHLLAAGEYRRALRAYRGPVLPRSAAPAVVEAREDLAHELRHVLFRNAAPEVLVEWAERPDGRRDPFVLAAALGAVPVGSPRAEQVRAWLDQVSG
ncbi:GAF domain-containing protein [Nocardiopsis sp. NPDC050513]|uniref:GAF domain-containing protein n=1 Tax=Nocardiopsis sp. NPDC050513 TaxID=3364338 RepID=UPI0037A85A3F